MEKTQKFRNEDDKKRFLEKVYISESCHLWTGSFDKNATPLFKMDKVYFAHRVAYESFIGPINGLTVYRMCFNPKCVNPEHLDLASFSQLRRIVSQRRGLSHFKRDTPCKCCGSFYFYEKTKQCIRCKRRMTLAARKQEPQQSSVVLSLSAPSSEALTEDTPAFLPLGLSTSHNTLQAD